MHRRYGVLQERLISLPVWVMLPSEGRHGRRSSLHGRCQTAPDPPTAHTSSALDPHTALPLGIARPPPIPLGGRASVSNSVPPKSGWMSRMMEGMDHVKNELPCCSPVFVLPGPTQTL